MSGFAPIGVNIPRNSAENKRHPVHMSSHAPIELSRRLLISLRFWLCRTTRPMQFRDTCRLARERHIDDIVDGMFPLPMPVALSSGENCIGIDADTAGND